MRIHSDILTIDSYVRAARKAGVSFHRADIHGSRSRTHAFDVILEGHGFTGTRRGQRGDYIAATWDEWGIFLASLFAEDPNAHATYYHDADHFHWSTGNRFETLTLDRQHVSHKWQPDNPDNGNYWQSVCKCGAMRRHERRPWAELRPVA